LADRCPALTEARGRSLAEAAAVCLEDQSHRGTAILFVAGDYETTFEILWPEVTEQMRRCYNDLEVATESGAYGIAILLVRELVGYTAVEQSRKGTGFDFWLGSDEDEFFQHKARLEVSGIRSGELNSVQIRVNQKIRQTKRSDALEIPAYIVVIEFSRPLAHLVQR
jgi:hypothetical protein